MHFALKLVRQYTYLLWHLYRNYHFSLLQQDRCLASLIEVFLWTIVPFQTAHQL